MRTSASNSGRGLKISSAICSPSNNRSWRDEVTSPRPKYNYRVPFLSVNRKDIVAFACNDDVDKSQLMQPFSEFLRDICRVHGQWKLRDVNPFTKKCSFELCQHEYE